MSADPEAMNAVSTSASAQEVVSTKKTSDDFSLLSENIDQIVLTLGPTLNFVTTNAAFQNATGWSNAVCAGKSLGLLLTAEDRDRLNTLVLKNAKSLTPFFLRLQFLCEPGNYIPLTLQFIPRSSGRVPSPEKYVVIGPAPDQLEPTTEKNNSTYLDQQPPSLDKMLFKNPDEKITQILDCITDGFFALSRDWTVLYANKETERIAGKKREEFLGKNMWDFMPDYIGTNAQKKYLEAMEGREPISFVEYVAPFDAWFETKLYPSEEGLLSYFRDVTVRHQAELAMRATIDRLMIALQSSKTAIWDWNVRTGEIYARGWKNVLGYDDYELGKYIGAWKKIIHPEDLERAEGIFDPAKLCDTTNCHFEIQQRLRDKKGAYHWILSRGVTFFDESDLPIRILGFHFDITQQKKIEEELERNQEQLARYHDDYRRLARIAASDIRNPLETMGESLEKIHQEMQSSGKPEWSQVLKSSVFSLKQVRSILDSLQHYTEAGKNDRQKQLVDCGSVMKMVAVNLEAELKDSNAKLVAENLPIVNSDFRQLVAIFQNLISNAIKFKSSSVLEIRVGAEELEDRWLLSVKDNGRGIPEARLQDLFQIWRQQGSSVSVADDEGSHGVQAPLGVGLAITYRLVNELEGKIWVNSKVGKGSTFYFTLPK